MEKFRELFEAKIIKKGDKFWDGIDQYRIDSVNTSKKTAMITFIPNGEGSSEIDFEWIKNTYITKTYWSDRSTNKKVEKLFESTTASQVKKVIRNVDLDLLDHQAYEVEMFNTDAGLGGEKVIKVIPRSTRSKDASDNKKVKSALSNKFNLTDKDGVWIIR